MPQKSHLSPPAYVVRVVGGPRATGRFVGRSHSSVIQWVAKGAIPPDSQRTILTKARAEGLDITAEDLILGRAVGADRGVNRDGIKGGVAPVPDGASRP